MIPTLDARPRRHHDDARGAALALDCDFGPLAGKALDLVERRYGDRGLAMSRERFSSRRHAGDIVCTARERGGDQIVGTLSVRFDGPAGLQADLLFKRELDAWRAEGATLCEFGGLAVDKHSLDPKRVLAQIFHLGYLHAHRRGHCDRLVVEVNPRHTAFYRRCLGLVPMTAPRHNPRVDAPAVLMSLDFASIREQISRWGGQPDRLASARSLYPLAWSPATEATLLAQLP